NHDYYGSSIVDVRQAVVELCARRSRLRWLPACGVVLCLCLASFQVWITVRA
ncbi:MAG: hypothetical protein H0W33_09090, partial [Gammaproteobacteria bacterium]|nr:hypothetical protein [Gammaproteobacteria bacterium]